MSDIQIEAKRIYQEHKRVVETWEKSPDHIKSALAQALKHFAGVQNKNTRS